jgi:hypothetical protein
MGEICGVCADGSGVCSTDADCPRDAGLGIAFEGSERVLRLDGLRSGPLSFDGFFVDTYEGVSLEGPVSSVGRFHLRRTSTAQCVDTSATEVRPLDVECLQDGDCPMRCTGGAAELEGFSCTADADCHAVLESGAPVSAFCEPYTCAFTRVADEGGDLFRQAPVTVTLGGSFDTLVSIEVKGVPGVIALTSDPGSVSLGSLPCGVYTVVASTSCGSQETTLDVCGSGTVGLTLACTDPDPAPEGDGALRGPAGLVLHGGPTLTDPLGLQGGGISLVGIGGQASVAGRDPFRGWTDRFGWPPRVVRSGLLERLVTQEQAAQP